MNFKKQPMTTKHAKTKVDRVERRQSKITDLISKPPKPRKDVRNMVPSCSPYVSEQGVVSQKQQSNKAKNTKRQSEANQDKHSSRSLSLNYSTITPSDKKNSVSSSGHANHQRANDSVTLDRSSQLLIKQTVPNQKSKQNSVEIIKKPEK